MTTYSLLSLDIMTWSWRKSDSNVACC